MFRGCLEAYLNSQSISFRHYAALYVCLIEKEGTIKGRACLDCTYSLQPYRKPCAATFFFVFFFLWLIIVDHAKMPALERDHRNVTQTELTNCPEKKYGDEKKILVAPMEREGVTMHAQRGLFSLH